MVKTVRFQEGVLAGEGQLGALIKVVVVPGGFQHVAQADVFRVKGGYRAGGVAVKGGKQWDTAL
ncbi:hypothetical protein D3C71_2179500 [compost metagenome]